MAVRAETVQGGTWLATRALFVASIALAGALFLAAALVVLLVQTRRRSR